MRPELLVAVVGTGTEVGKTWVTAAVAGRLRADGVVVRARKPAQSFDPSDPPDGRDAAVLARATGEEPDEVCLPYRSYDRAMAPPMAAAALGREPIVLDELVGELAWPEGTTVGFVETAGGVRAPIADDGDNVELVRRLAPDITVLVGDAGLGTINLVRLSAGAIGDVGGDLVVVLNRFDATDDLHGRNRDWLHDVDGLDVVTSVDALVDALVAESQDGSVHGAG